MPPSGMRPLAVLRSWIKRGIRPRIPEHVSRRFRSLDSAGADAVSSSLKRHYFTRPIWGERVTAEVYLSSEEGKSDLLDHLDRRLNVFRRTVIPWLDEAKPLSGASVLEIGCGTGSSAVALAEQGAAVTAVDIDPESLVVARERCRVYDLTVEFVEANATEVRRLFAGRHFDFVIFFACLEHMTHEERIIALRNAWNMLSSDDLLCVVDTPNRLWYLDGHTSHLPFYLWLPDDLAFSYSRFSPRHPFNKTYVDKTDEAMLGFLRRGRGVSYHEFDLAIKNIEDLDVVGSLPIWLRRQNPLWALGRRLARTSNYRYESFLVDVGPRIDRGFYQSSLDLIIRRD